MAKPKIDIAELFEGERACRGYVNISAPMVRYSKLEFRTLLRKYDVKICYTPMIVADSFCKSGEARRSEFTTNEGDSPVIAQFAARNSIDLLTAAEMVYPYVDGVDLNCGCPQSWAISDGYGCALLKQPDLVYDMIKTTKRNLPNRFSVSIKMRILEKNLSTTVNLCRQLEACGVTFLTIHGRRPWQRSSEPVDVDGLAELKKSLKLPVVVNGDVKMRKDADYLYKATNCDGVMVARGLLSNPTLFTGTHCTPTDCIQEWVNLAQAAGDHITFQCFHHHLTFMMEKLISKRLRVKFNNFTNKNDIFQFLDDVFQIKPQPVLEECRQNGFLCIYDEKLYGYRTLTGRGQDEAISYDDYKKIMLNNGRFFDEFQSTAESVDSGDELGQLDFMGSSIFNCL